MSKFSRVGLAAVGLIVVFIALRLGAIATGVSGIGDAGGFAIDVALLTAAIVLTVAVGLVAWMRVATFGALGKIRDRFPAAVVLPVVVGDSARGPLEAHSQVPSRLGRLPGNFQIVVEPGQVALWRGAGRLAVRLAGSDITHSVGASSTWATTSPAVRVSSAEQAGRWEFTFTPVWEGGSIIPRPLSADELAVTISKLNAAARVT